MVWGWFFQPHTITPNVSPVAQAAANWAGAFWRCRSPHRRWWFPGPCWSLPTPAPNAVLGCGPGVLKKVDPCPSGMENQMKTYRTQLRLDLKNCSIYVKVAELTRSFQWLGGSMPIFSINEDYHRIIYNPKHQPVQVVTKVWLLADPRLNWVDVWIPLCKPIQSHKGCNPSRMVNGWLLSGPVVGK